jgi:hypothetical protein
MFVVYGKDVVDYLVSSEIVNNRTKAIDLGQVQKYQFATNIFYLFLQ